MKTARYRLRLYRRRRQDVSVSRQRHRPDADAHRSAGGLSGQAPPHQCEEPGSCRRRELPTVLNDCRPNAARRSWSMAVTSRSKSCAARARHQYDFACRDQELPDRLHRLWLDRSRAAACRNAMVLVPSTSRLAVGLAGPFAQPHEGSQQRGLRARPLPRRRILDRHGHAGEFARLPQDYAGGIWTNEIEAIAPITRK